MAVLIFFIRWMISSQTIYNRERSSIGKRGVPVGFNYPPEQNPANLFGNRSSMQIRIRLTRPGEARKVAALAAGSLLMPLALIAFTMALWGFASEFQWAGAFFVATGLFAHWQVWLALSAVLSLIARILGDYGINADATI
jgi:hypothetical protein